MNRALQLQHLALAERHIAEGEQHITKQQDIIAHLERDGHAATAAEARAMLRILLETQAKHEEHRRHLLDELKQ